jgi:hypothetical protein
MQPAMPLASAGQGHIQAFCLQAGLCLKVVQCFLARCQGILNFQFGLVDFRASGRTLGNR